MMPFSIEEPLFGLSEIKSPLFDTHLHIWDPKFLREYLEVARKFGSYHALIITKPEIKKQILSSGYGDFLSSSIFAYYLPLKPFATYDSSVLMKEIKIAEENSYDVLKFWFAPRFIDYAKVELSNFNLLDPRLEPVFDYIEESQFRGILMHVSDPDLWYTKKYTDSGRYGTKSKRME